jgi:glutathionylspermidine synthase
LALDAEDVADLRATARDGWAIMQRAALLARSMDDEALIAMGYPSNALAAITGSVPADAIVARFDCIRTPGGYRIIECNADTPFLLMEAFRRCGAVVATYGMSDPNDGLESNLGKAYAHAIRDANATPHASYAITAYDALEDRMAAEYLREIITPHLDRDIRLSPLAQLDATLDALVDANGPIDVLLRLYPLEHFAADRGGDAFLSLLERKRLHTINPPGALFTQNKFLQVLIWQLAALETYFTPGECTTIKQRFLPTYAERPEIDGPWIVKPALGREGSDVRPDDGSDVTGFAVWQQTLEIPRITHAGLDGFGVASCFVVKGEPSAIAMRIGGLITNPTAAVIPLAIRT